MKNLEQQSLSSIVLEQHELVPVLEKYNLDFCCRGKQTLAEACAEKNIDLAKLVLEMNESVSPGTAASVFTRMSAEELIAHILPHHHFYVKNSMPVIINHLDKLVSKHGERYPHLNRILQLFTAVKDEMLAHMQKEEQVLFPRIKEITALISQEKELIYLRDYITSPIKAMETEHDHAGQALFEIRRITNNYTAPEDACTTHQVCLQELKAFENDLHQHVHLENNILFPMALGFVRHAGVQSNTCSVGIVGS